VNGAIPDRGAAVTAVVLTRDEAAHLEDCLASLAWTDAVLVLDSGSRDGTPELAARRGARVETRPFDNFSRQRNAALERVATPWALFVDADERVSPELAAEVRATLARPEAAGYWIPRRNLFWGHAMRGGGWWPDRQLRLLAVAAARYDPERAVHEVAEVAGPTAALGHCLTHLNYDSPAEFWAKQAAYARLEAERRRAGGFRTRRRQWLTLPLRAFHHRYVALRGWRDGLTGLIACLGMAAYELAVLRRLAEEEIPAGSQ
jgi:glycosyltransferase involved in cell wall biosynthesis